MDTNIEHHLVAKCIKLMMETPADDRLVGWASETLSVADRQALVDEARDDDELAAQLERLQPLDQATRSAIFEEALSALEDEAPQVNTSTTLGLRWKWDSRWFNGYRLGFMEIALSISLLVLIGFGVRYMYLSSSLRWIQKPLHHYMSALDSVELSVASTSQQALELHVIVKDQVLMVPVEWTSEGQIQTVSAPAHILSGGHFGGVELVVTPKGTPSSEVMKRKDLLRVRLEVGLPEYQLEEVLAVLSKRTRVQHSYRGSSFVEVPRTAEAIRFALLPQVNVRSGAIVCVFQEIGDQLREVVKECLTRTKSRIEFELAAEDLDTSSRGGDLIIAVGPQEQMPTKSRVESITRAMKTPSGWRLLRVQLKPSEEKNAW